MGNIAGLRCWDCNRTIGEKESYWGYHYLGGVASSVYCLECLVRIKTIIGQDAPLLPPEGWLPPPMGSAKPARPSEVKPERSEP
jgi:hypothetical protein